MRRLRLLKVAYFQGLMSAKTLDFGSWASGPLGWACRMPEIQRLGLNLETLPDGTSQVAYEGDYGWPAVARFFDISEAQAESVFGARAYWDLPRTPLPDDVSRCIREFVASAGAGRVEL